MGESGTAVAVWPRSRSGEVGAAEGIPDGDARVVVAVVATGVRIKPACTAAAECGARAERPGEDKGRVRAPLALELALGLRFGIGLALFTGACTNSAPMLTHCI